MAEDAGSPALDLDTDNPLPTDLERPGGAHDAQEESASHDDDGVDSEQDALDISLETASDHAVDPAEVEPAAHEITESGGFDGGDDLQLEVPAALGEDEEGSEHAIDETSGAEIAEGREALGADIYSQGSAQENGSVFEATTAEHDGRQGTGTQDSNRADRDGFTGLVAGDSAAGASEPLDRTRTPQFHTEFRHTLGAGEAVDASSLDSSASLQVAREDVDGTEQTGTELDGTSLSIDLGELSQEDPEHQVQAEVSSPEAAELLISALEEEADRDAQAEMELEAQILEYADSVIPARAAPGGASMLDRAAAWLPGPGSALSPTPSNVMAPIDEDTRTIEDELVQAAVRWILLDAIPSPISRPQSVVGGLAPTHPADSARVAAGVEEEPLAPQFVTEHADHREEDVAAARRVLADVERLLGDATACVTEAGAGRATATDAIDTTAAGKAEGLLQAQTAAVRREFSSTLASAMIEGNASEPVAAWARARAALVLQLAVRCHRSRRMRMTLAMRRAGNERVDFERMACRLIEDLNVDERPDDDEVYALIAHCMGVLRQLPEELARQVQAVVRESPAPIPATIRTHAVNTIGGSWRCHIARLQLQSSRANPAPSPTVSDMADNVPAGAGEPGERIAGDTQGDGGGDGNVISGDGEVGVPGSGDGDTDILLPGEVLLPDGRADPAGATAGAPVSVGGAEKGDSGRAQDVGDVATGQAQLSLVLPRVMSTHSDSTNGMSVEPSQDSVGVFAEDSRVLSEDGDAATPSTLREAAARIEAERELKRQETVEAEKMVQGLIESEAPRDEVKSAEQKARELRQATETLRVKAESLTATAMRMEDDANEHRAASRGGTGVLGLGLSATGGSETVSAVSDWQEKEQRAAEEEAREAKAEQDRRRAKELELEEASKRRAHQAEISAIRRAETFAANQLKLIHERTELARRTLKIDYSGLGMSSLPSIIYTDPVLRNIRILWLNENEFEELPADIGHFQLLTQLRIFKNRLRQLPPQIGDLAALQILWLQDNFLTTLPPEIEKLSNLTLLSLKGNPLTVLPVELSRLKKVRDLEMTTDNVTFPPPAISRSGTKRVLEFLRRADRAWKTDIMDISNMELDLLPLDIITLFPNITGLFCDSNQITQVPFEFHVMTQLEVLRFDQHLMRSPSMEIWELGIQRTMEFMYKFTRYKVDPRVDLCNWQLQAIPDEVFDNKLGPRVTLFDFSQNRLPSLPEMIDMMTALRELRLDENVLEKLPRSLCSLSNLHRLSVTRNGLRSFPNQMHLMHSLRFLYLDDNELEAIPNSIIRAQNLEEVSFCSNRIFEFPEGMPQLRKLRNMIVADNRIERLPFEFYKFTFLTKLNIMGNLIWSPPPDIMKQGMQWWFEYLKRLSKALATVKVPGPPPSFLPISGGVLELESFGLNQCPPELVRLTQIFSHMVFMNFDYNNLSVLPREIGKLTNLTRLSFNRNKFRIIPECLGKCYNLTDMNFERNALTFLPKEIGNLTALKKLNVEGNNLTQPPMEIVRMGIPAMLRFLKVFSEAAGSGEVVMAGCDLRVFPMAVVDIYGLKRLDLSHNYIGRVPAEFFQHPNVRYVDLSYNDICEIEPGIGNILTLETLILSGNHVEEIPHAIFKLTRLRTLILNQNEVAEIPKEIGVMTWLQVLRLSNNNIDIVPMEIGRMASLQKLVLAYNFIRALPTTIGNMTALKELAISGNYIDHLPPIMGAMSGLRELHISDNSFSRHPPEVVEAAMVKQRNTKIWHDGTAPATSLCLWLSRMRTARITKDLDASHFSLVQIPREVLSATTLQLLRLSFEHNVLDEIPAEVNYLSTLTFLNLAHNNLRTIPKSIGTMTNLTVLYLNNNKITRLPIEIGHLRQTILSRLSISNNRLETPPKELLTSSTQHLLKYYLTSEVAMLTGNLDWSWTMKITSMRRICSEVLNWQRLVVVFLDNNDIDVLDAEMCLDMPYLEILSLNKNRITLLPPELSQHTQIRTLCLSQNRITKLPISLGSMRSLHRLDFQGNAITMPPQTVLKYGTENICAYLCALQQAENSNVCIISDFDLAEIPQEVLVMTNVDVLEMNNMRLTAIPDALVALASLTRLSVCNNAIKHLPVSIAQLTNLTELEFDHNSVGALLPEHHVLTNLVWLNVFANPIKTPPFEIVRLILPKGAAVRQPRHDGQHGRGGAGAVTRHPREKRHASPDGRRSLSPGQPGEHTPLQEVEDPRRPRPDTILAFLKALHVALSENYLDVRRFGLVMWPPEVKNSPAITRMHIDDNKLRAVPDDVQFVSRLVLLTLDNNEFNTISPALGKLTDLKELSIAHNKLEEIPACFGELVNLTKLSLVDNAIAVLPIELFRCVALQTLLLDNNKVTELPPELAELVHLSVLSYEHNPVVNPPAEIRNQGLQQMLAFYKRIIANAPACHIKGIECEEIGGNLNLDEFQLEELPFVVHRGLPRPGELWNDYSVRRDRWGLGMTHLTSLSLKSNLLVGLPELISRLQLLTALVASNNEIKSIPDSVGNLTDLVTLDLTDNNLVHIPPTTSNLSQLRLLLLNNNSLVELPDGLGHLPALREIHVKDNALTSLPIDLCQTQSLRILDVNINPLRMPPLEIVERGLRSIFDFLSRLWRCQTTQTLDLRALDLDSIDYEILPIPTLKRVLLANNRMTSISGKKMEDALSHAEGKKAKKKEIRGNRAKTETVEEGTESADKAPKVTLVALEYMNADYNLLPELPETVTTLTSLTELSLVGNRITQLPNGLFVLTNLVRINVRSNPITQLPLDFGEMSTLRKLDIDLERLTLPPQEIANDGFPIMMRYLRDLRVATTRTNQLELIGMKLISIPSEVLTVTSMTKLVLTSNRIQEIDLRLCDMKPLTDLWLSRNEISKIPRQLFESLTNLTCLRLDENKISVIPLQVCNMSRLLELRLHKNLITILPLEMGNLLQLQVLTLDTEDMVSPIPEVCDRGPMVITTYLRAVQAARLNQTVDLRGLGLTSFPVEIYTISSITALHLDDNNLTSLPPSVERLTDLTELTLTNLQLQNLPFVMGAMTNLKKLRLTVSRYMQNPPYEIVTQGTAVLLTYMRKCYLCVRQSGYMNISDMSLEQLPKDILSLGNLRHLQARDNVILHIGKAMDQMNCIQKLHLHGNGLLYLPPEVGHLITLVELRLGYNRLKVLPKELGHCFNLRKLSCQSNLLSTLPGEMLSGLSCLLNLNVSCNQIVFVPDELGEMINLEKLRMDQNQVRNLPETIGACTALMILSLTCNQLSNIPDSFQECVNLTALHISSNRFRQLPRCVDNLMQLRQLWASNNELIGLPTSLARLPNLVELQVKGSPDLRFPPPDIVTGGREAIINFLMSNMRYEDTQNLAAKEEVEAQFAEAKAKDDAASAELAASLVAPLQRIADETDLIARDAEKVAMQLRAKANVHKRFDIREQVLSDTTLLPEEQAVEIDRLENKANEDEGTAVEAETKAARLRADADAAMAKANEARQISDALVKIAENSAHYARQKRLDADAQKAIDGNDAGQQSDEDAFSHCSSHDDHDHTEDVHDVFKKASVL